MDGSETRVLVVAGMAADRFANGLRAAGFDVGIAPTEEAARQVLDRTRPDLVVAPASVATRLREACSVPCVSLPASPGVRADGGSKPVRSLPGSGGAGDVPESLKTRAMDEAPIGITIADAQEEDTPLVYVNAAFERVTGYSATEALGNNCRFLQGEETEPERVDQMREAIAAGESISVTLRNYTRDGELFWNEVTLAPLFDEDGIVTHYVGFQVDVTERKQAARAAKRYASELEAERERQRALLDRLDGVIGDVSAATARARSRSALEEDVADTLGQTYAAAWVGALDLTADAIEPRAWSAGAKRLAADPIPVGESGGPVADAVESREVAVCRNLESMSHTGITAGDDAFAAMAVAPLAYGDTCYGALCVYATDADAFEGHERAVLTAVGEVVATGLNALESQRMLSTDPGLTVELTVRDSTLPLVELAAGAGCQLSLAGAVPDTNGEERRLLFDVAGATPEEVTAAAANVGGIEAVATLVEREDGPLVELGVETPLFALLDDHGTVLTGLTADGEELGLRLRPSTEAMARSLVEAVRERYAEVDLQSYRQDAEPPSPNSFAADLEERLTDRQLSALVRASEGGFFEWPHEVSGDKLADAMGVSRSTFHQHLRTAERKLVEAFLERREESNGPLPGRH